MPRRKADKPAPDTNAKAPKTAVRKPHIISGIREQRNSYEVNQRMKAYQSTRFVAYYRVSTKRQGKSGLGLEAQREAVRTFASERGYEIIAEYTEVESGKNPQRPELEAAMLHARKYRAGLVVGKLDRLGRKAWHLLKLLDESKVPLRFADFPDADETLLGFMIIIADREGKLIAQRTKAALSVAKAKGVKLGSNRPGHWTETAIRKRDKSLVKATAQAAKKNKAEAQEFYALVGPDVIAYRNQGLSFDAIAEKLNGEKIPSRRGGQWYAGQVRHVFLKLTEGAEE